MNEIAETLSDLRRTIAWMDLALAKLQEGLVVVEAKDMRIRYANDAFAKMVGQQRIFVLGAPLLQYFPKVRAGIDGMPRQTEHQLEGPDSRRIIEVQAAGLSFSADEMILVFRDITERRAAEDELSCRRAELERSNEDLQHFATFASHDLQEPLRKMALYSQLLRQRYSGKLDSQADSIINSVVTGAGRMQELIKGLQRYCSLERDTAAFNTVDCQSVFKEAVNDLEVAIQESGAVVAVGPLPIVKADLAQLIQVFENLIGNAIKFRAAKAPRVEVGSKKLEGEWLFWVKDNGIGIEPEYFNRIFQLFGRLHAQHHYPGSGIGLALSQRIIERHGGRIWVESKPNQGSAFFFTLPERA